MKTYQGFGKNVTPSEFFTDYEYTLTKIWALNICMFDKFFEKYTLNNFLG